MDTSIQVFYNALKKTSKKVHYLTEKKLFHFKTFVKRL